MSGKPTICTEANHNVFSFNGGNDRMVFASLRPLSGRTLDRQWQDLGGQIAALLQNHGLTRDDIVKESVFLRRRSTKRSILARLKDFYSGTIPATSFILQPPADGEHLSLEFLAIKSDQVRVERISEHLTVVRDADGRWGYVGGIEPAAKAQNTFSQALSCFRQMRQHLKQAGFHFDQVVRTWIYERDIVGMEKSGSRAPRQRYQIMNDARRWFFVKGNGGRAFTFSHNLPPASTGIGMSEGTFVMECLALDVPKRSIEITPLKNPEQIDAHAYSQEVLERGAAAIKAAPLFSRGMSIRKDYRMMLISGTASIKGQETVCLDDPIGQARTTLENIDLVLRQAQASLKDVQQLRVYIKDSVRKPELNRRVQTIRRVVKTMLPGVPTLFLIGDVCRENLLVEIEALSFVKHG